MTAPAYTVVTLRLERVDALALEAIVRQNKDKDRTAAIRRLIREAFNGRKDK